MAFASGRRPVEVKVDVLVAVGTQTAPYAKNDMDGPVVFLFVPNAVGSGFVES